MTKHHTTIRVGQRLIFHDGTRGYVAGDGRGIPEYGPGKTFLVQWLHADGKKGDAEQYTLEAFAQDGITFGRGVMPWAR